MASTTTLNEAGRTVDGTEYVRLATAGANWKAVLSDFSRLRKAGGVSYYVRTDGSDSNTGLADTAGAAFLTLQHAYDVVTGTLDLSGGTATINVANGTYSGIAISSVWTGGGSVTFTGNTATPASCIIDGGGGDAINCTAVLPGSLTFNGFKILSGDVGISHTGGGTLTLQNIDFGLSANIHIQAGAIGAYVVLLTPYTISGNTYYHWNAQTGGEIFVGGGDATVTFSGTPTVGVFANFDLLGILRVSGLTFTGAPASGTQKYSGSANSVIGTGGASTNYLPGNVAGTLTTGAQYT